MRRRHRGIAACLRRGLDELADERVREGALA